MDLVKKYGDYIKKTLQTNPEKAGRLIRLGLREEIIRYTISPDPKMPKAFRMLQQIALKSTLTMLKDPKHCCWTNIFAPVELMQCFDLSCVSMELLASFMSGFTVEDDLISKAESEGIAPTLCSYHKNFMGGVDSGLLPLAGMYVTTSMICDGNINTFRHVERKHGVPGFVLDIPHEYSPDAEAYVVDQLKELIAMLEAQTGKSYDENRLREIIRRENASKAYLRSFMMDMKTREYPSTMTLCMYMLFATHLDIGSKQSLDFFKLLAEDVKNYPAGTKKKIFWIHLMPYYQETLKKYFNYNDDYYFQGFDMNLDYMEEMDDKKPLEALARKMILNIYNGPYERKVMAIKPWIEMLGSDAVINFCHWGCKQSSGGVMLLKEELRQLDIPMLILDGDAVDRRNSHDGQIRTRLEAFLEVLDRSGEGDIGDEKAVCDREISDDAATNHKEETHLSEGGSC